MHVHILTVVVAFLGFVYGLPAYGPRSSWLSLPPPSKRAVTCPGTGQKQFLPTLRTINDPTTDPKMFHVANTTAVVNQVATFSNIPATASNFVLWWAQSASPPDFRVIGGGTVAVYALDSSKLPRDGALTPQAVDAAVDAGLGIPGTGGRVGGAAFGGWPAVKTAQDHLVGQLNAGNRAEFSFKLSLEDASDIWLLQDQQNGWFLRYDC
ncbi:uncharacterized protein PV09_03568 [Verruconis gallopava]|uniref:Uncharacterized protein n=1 Tax=Verruconis gallopava TaxID=253628 RepID=A0A0D2AFG0_9PEZI|nr:uncharacterized protein PV09_03568 [Verruconis gallopava]KIW05708.1 hypothetical protein PV09_03568 [Verruconis gallopava]